MPLSKSVRRETIHNRSVSCHGYKREDGLWDIEGRMVDTKPYVSELPERKGGFVNANEPLHDMWIRLTLDDEFKIHAVEAVTESAPFKGCPQVTGVFQKLVGTSIGLGWNRTVKQLMGGKLGCTHLTELLGPIATTAFQAIAPSKPEFHGKEGGDAGVEKNVLINSCHMLDESGDTVKEYWPQFHKPAN